MRGLRELGGRLLAIADEPGDDDDRRLRRRIGVVIGYVTLVAPLGAAPLSGWNPVAVVLAIALPAWSGANLVVLARTHRFERYVVAILVAGVTFTLLMQALIGGLGAGAGIIWTFLTPVYAILALGPRKSLPWFAIFVAAVLFAVIIDPVVTASVRPPPYAVELISFGQNIILPLGLTFSLFYYTDVRRRAAEARSEELLTNAIPESIARRLKRGETRIAEAYPQTTILFSDIVDFTPWATRTAPDRVVELLDDLFTRFDGLAAACGMEKIKTIGDAYMAVSGAPEPEPAHAEVAIAMAERMLDAVAAWRDTHGVDLQIRIGLASGPSVAGVIGQRRILFDLWGDTVNTAARMEQFGIPGRIQVARGTWELLRERHTFEPREVEVKGLGKMRTYLVASSASASSPG